MDTNTDIKKITNAIVTLAIFGAQKLSKASQALAIKDILAKLKTAFDSITPDTPPNQSQLATAIFQILSAIADISKNVYVQDVESLARQLYTIFTGGQGADFETVWNDIKVLFNGKLKGVAAADPNPTADAQALETGIVVVLSYILSKLPQGTTKEDITAIIEGIKTGLDSADAETTISNDEAMGAIYEILEAIADLTGTQTPLAIEQLLEKIYNVITGSQSEFVKFFESIGIAIKAKHAAKLAAKEAQK